ncbi:MAG: hypothetical protein EOP14_04130 [Pseudomonas sp.]|nr:MAG: hypothetical protein EOP14_04130 [Pseudomonas sp.]
MSTSDISIQVVCDVLAPFGTLRSQPASDWTGEIDLHPSLARFYKEVGPCGENGPHDPGGLIIPTTGNPFEMSSLANLWDKQAGYRLHGLSGKRMPLWPDEWLVVSDQGGDPFILDLTTGAILHARHGEGAWKPKPMFANVFVMALVLGTIGTVYEEGGDEIFDDDFEVRAEWRVALRTRLASFLTVTEAEAIASRFDW